MSDLTKVEYRVVPIVRYAVTRYHEGDGGAGVEQRGEYNNAETAYDVGYALASAEHQRLGWPPGDMRIMYPDARHKFGEAAPTTPRAVASADYRVPVPQVLAGAGELADVALVGVQKDGGLYVASSLGTPQTLALFAKARPHVEELRAS